MVHLNDEFDIQLKETDQRFQKTYNQGIVGRDIEGILTEDTAFNDYVAALTESFEPEVQESLEGMMQNTRAEILTESSMGQIQPFASLTMPMLVKLWARLVMTQAIPTEPVNTPVFTVRWVKPYIMGHDGTKYYLPETINGMPDDNPEITGMRQFLPVIENDKTGASLFNAGRLSKYDLYTGLEDLNVDRSKEDAVDRRFFIVGAKWSDAIGTRKQTDGTVAAEDKGWVDFKNSQIIRLDTSNNLRGSIEYVQDDGTGKPAAVAAEDTIQGFVDTARGYLTVMSVSGKLEAIKIRGYVSSEQHTYATQEGFEIEGREIQIPTAQHIEATFPIEWLQDLKAMYNIDGTAYIVDQMSRTIQQRVDMDIIQFLENSYKDTGAAFHKTFDVYPQGQYALTPTEWQSQLRTLVDFLTQEMRQTFKSYDATFTIVGNPLDIMLLPDVSWTFQGAATNVGGVGVNYSIGAVSGIATYKILSSDLIPQGKLKIIGIPQREDYRTFKYYPYTFNVVNNYNNSVNPALPNLMMTKRYTLEEFTPIIGEIDILHNDGTVFNER